MLTHAQFDRTKRLALQLAGIELHDRHHKLLGYRSQRIGIQDSMGLDTLLNAAEEGDPAASRCLVELLTTRHTGFFRHPHHFDVAASHARRIAQRGGSARMWCAAVATGEEAYSLAMGLIEAFQQDDPPATIVATDINTESLAIAEQGAYKQRALQGLTPAQCTRFFSEKTPGMWCVASAVRALVEFEALNLVDESWSFNRPFDVIFCRNVLMYLESSHRQAVLERIATLLAPTGLLIIDPTEHLGRARHLFASGHDGCFRSLLSGTSRDKIYIDSNRPPKESS